MYKPVKKTIIEMLKVIKSLHYKTTTLSITGSFHKSKIKTHYIITDVTLSLNRTVYSIACQGNIVQGAEYIYRQYITSTGLSVQTNLYVDLSGVITLSGPLTLLAPVRLKINCTSLLASPSFESTCEVSKYSECLSVIVMRYPSHIHYGKF